MPNPSELIEKLEAAETGSRERTIDRICEVLSVERDARRKRFVDPDGQVLDLPTALGLARRQALSSQVKP